MGLGYVFFFFLTGKGSSFPVERVAGIRVCK